MSWQAQHAVTYHSKQRNERLLRVLMIFADGADETGIVDPAPSQDTLAKFFDVSERTIRNWLNVLLDSGEITRSRRGRGEGNASAYQINLPMPEVTGSYEEVNAGFISGNYEEERGRLEERLKSLEEKIGQILPVIENLQEKQETVTGKTGNGNRKAHSTKSADDPLITNVVVINDLETATTTPAHAKQLQPDTTNLKVVEAVLNWLGFVGNIQAEIAQHNLTAETALGWAFWMRLNQERMVKRDRDPLAITIASWRKGANLPADLRRLARAWLAMNDQERRLALDAAEASRYAGKLYLPQVLLHFDLPPDTLRKLYMAHEAFAPPSLMPPPPPASAEDEEPAPPVLRPTPIPPKTSYEMSVDEAAVWESTLGELELQMTKQTFATWLKDSKLHLNGTGAQVLVRNDYAAQWINGRLADTVARTLSAVAGKPLSITAVVDGAS